MRLKGFRIEKDSMGEMQVPVEALWGPQTQRAVENFPISSLRLPRAFIRAMGLIKASAAAVNGIFFGGDVSPEADRHRPIDLGLGFPNLPL